MIKNSLPSKKERVKLYTESYSKLSILGEYQKKKIFKELDENNDFGDLYVVYSIDSIWASLSRIIKAINTDFEEDMSSTARMAFETILRLEYFIQQSDERKEAIAVSEITRISERFYEFTNDKKFKNEIIRIEKKRKYSTPKKASFPDIRQLCESTKLDFGKNPYFYFQALSEFSHGQLMSLIMKKEYTEDTSALGMATIIAKEMIKFQDFLLNGKTKLKVAQTINECSILISNIRKKTPLIGKIKNEFGKKIGRNDPCPCGKIKSDGKIIKYKHCHGK